MFASEIRKKRVQQMRAYLTWKWHVGEVLVKTNGERHYLWRAVDHEGEVLENFVTKRPGISINSIWNVYDDLASGRLIRVLPDVALADDLALWMIYPRANVMSAKVRVFMDFLTEEIGRNPPWAGVTT